MKDITKKYSNEEITVVWKPALCIHSAICWKPATGLPEVFNPMKKPWINIDGSSTELIIEQVNKCPSGALSFIYNYEKNKLEQSSDTIIEVRPNGPLIIKGNITVKLADGNEVKKEKTQPHFAAAAIQTTNLTATEAIPNNILKNKQAPLHFIK